MEQDGELGKHLFKGHKLLYFTYDMQHTLISLRGSDTLVPLSKDVCYLRRPGPQYTFYYHDALYIVLNIHEMNDFIDELTSLGPYCKDVFMPHKERDTKRVELFFITPTGMCFKNIFIHTIHQHMNNDFDTVYDSITFAHCCTAGLDRFHDTSMYNYLKNWDNFDWFKLCARDILQEAI